MTHEQHIKALFIINSYTTQNQMLKTVEELNELSTAIMQHINKEGGYEAEIFEEICDVEIMLDQIKSVLPYGDNQYEKEVSRKLDRQLERIRNQNRGCSLE